MQKTRLTEGVIDTKVQTTIDDDTDNGGEEATVETGNSIRGERLAVDVDETIELTTTSAFGRLGVVSETGTSVVQRVDEK